MKKIMLVCLLSVITLMVNAQTDPSNKAKKNYYQVSNEILCNENQFKLKYEAVLQGLPGKYVLVPEIFHRIVKNDSIINYAIFHAREKISSTELSKFEPVFKQDPLYLLLDKKLPDFNLKDLNGKSFNSSELTGKPTMINFWNILCGPCVAEFPMLNQLKQKYDSKVNFIAITDDRNTNNRITDFLHKHPFDFYQLEGEVYKRMINVSFIPRNLFVDKNGILRDIQMGLPFEKDKATGNSLIKSNKPFEQIIEKLIKM